MTDPLTDPLHAVLHPVLHNVSGKCSVPMLRDAVRVWLAAVLDAHGAPKRTRHLSPYDEGWLDALDSLEDLLGITRPALGVVEPVAKEAEG